MKGELSQGLRALTTAGNRIVCVETGEPVLLRGVNRSGLEYSEPGQDGFLAAAGISRGQVALICQGWQANIIRLPFTQDWALRGRGGYSGENYLAALDSVIAWAAELGAYTLLDLQWLHAEDNFGTLADGSPQRIAPLPDAETPELWRMLAERYREEPAVLFDIYNEPHDVSAREWRQCAQGLVGAIRGICPGTLLFVGGADWAYDLRDVPFDGPNLVWSTHVYRGKRTAWRAAFGGLAQDAPVFAGEWGGSDEDLAWGRSLAGYLQSLQMGWTAWSWVDWPLLQRDGQPTPFGELVKQELTRSETS